MHRFEHHTIAILWKKVSCAKTRQKELSDTVTCQNTTLHTFMCQVDIAQAFTYQSSTCTYIQAWEVSHMLGDDAHTGWWLYLIVNLYWLLYWSIKNDRSSFDYWLSSNLWIETWVRSLDWPNRLTYWPIVFDQPINQRVRQSSFPNPIATWIYTRP